MADTERKLQQEGLTTKGHPEKFYHTTQKGTQSRTYELFTSGMFHFLCSDLGWPRLTKTARSEATCADEGDHRITLGRAHFSPDGPASRSRCSLPTERAGSALLCPGAPREDEGRENVPRREPVGDATCFYK